MGWHNHYNELEKIYGENECGIVYLQVVNNKHVDQFKFTIDYDSREIVTGLCLTLCLLNLCDWVDG